MSFSFPFPILTFHDWDSALKVMLVILLIVEDRMMVRETIRRAEMPFITTIHESRVENTRKRPPFKTLMLGMFGV